MSDFTPAALALLFSRATGEGFYKDAQALHTRCRNGQLGHKPPGSGVYLISPEEALALTEQLVKDKRSPLFGLDPRAILGLPPDPETPSA